MIVLADLANGCKTFSLGALHVRIKEEKVKFISTSFLFHKCAGCLCYFNINYKEIKFSEKFTLLFISVTYLLLTITYQLFKSYS